MLGSLHTTRELITQTPCQQRLPSVHLLTTRPRPTPSHLLPRRRARPTLRELDLFHAVTRCQSSAQNSSTDPASPSSPQQQPGGDDVAHSGQQVPGTSSARPTYAPTASGSSPNGPSSSSGLQPGDVAGSSAAGAAGCTSETSGSDAGSGVSSSSSSTAAPSSPAQPAAAAAAAAAPSRRGTLYFIGSVVAVMASGVANRVLYKMAITPLANYVFFMAQLQTFGYCAVYFTILALRIRSGKVSRETLGVPRSHLGLFTRIGLVEAISSLLGFLGAANLPGVVLPLLSQTVMFWQVLLARFMLGKQLGRAQVAGVLMVVAGVVLAAAPSRGAASVLQNVHPGYAWLFVLSMLFPALDTIYKERLFREVRAQRGQDLDLFIVNSFGSLAQAAFVLVLLPLIASLRGMTLGELPAYVSRGFQCLRGLTPSCGSDCTGAPLLPLAYVATNLVFNIAALSLIRTAGNVTMSLVMSALVPITIWAFTVNLPFLPPAPPVGPTFLAGAALLLCGLVAYNAPLWAPALRKQLQQWLAPGRGGDGGGVANVVSG